MPSVHIRTRTRRRYVNGGVRNMEHRVISNSHRLAYNYAQRVEGGAKRRAHVITGRMRRSIRRFRVRPGYHRVVVGAYYGVYENYGTRYRPPHPFWEPAIRAARLQYDRDKRGIFKP